VPPACRQRAYRRRGGHAPGTTVGLIERTLNRQSRKSRLTCRTQIIQIRAATGISRSRPLIVQIGGSVRFAQVEFRSRRVRRRGRSTERHGAHTAESDVVSGEH